MNATKKKNVITTRRVRRTRSKLFGTSTSPRLSVFRSNKFTYAQLIDDLQGKTLVSVSTKDAGKNPPAGGKVAASEILGETLAKKAKDAKIDAAIFDRGGYKYHGRVKAVAEGARKAGLKI